MITIFSETNTAILEILELNLESPDIDGLCHFSQNISISRHVHEMYLLPDCYICFQKNGEHFGSETENQIKNSL